MNIDVVPSHCYMKGSHLVEDNIHTKTWSFKNTNYKYEHVMHKFLNSYSQPLHGWETWGSPCAHLKTSLHLIWNVIWHLYKRMIVKHTILFISGTWRIWRRLTLTHWHHRIRGINVGFIWQVTELSPYTHWLKTD